MLHGLPGLAKNGYHTFFMYKKNAYYTLSYNFIEQKYINENSKIRIFSINEIV